MKQIVRCLVDVLRDLTPFGRFALALLLALTGTGSAPARALDAWELIAPTDLDWRIVDHRRMLAEDLLDRLSLLAAAVPEQTPERVAGIRREVAELAQLDPGAEPRRRSRLYMSRHYQHYRLLALLDETSGHLQCVLDAGHIKPEMRCWSLAAVSFGEETTLDMALAMLRASRLMPRDGAMPVKAQDPSVWYGEYGRGIVKHILTPYLAAEAALAIEAQGQKDDREADSAPATLLQDSASMKEASH